MELFYDKYLQAAGSTPSTNDYTAPRTLPHCLLLRLLPHWRSDEAVDSVVFQSWFLSTPRFTLPSHLHSHVTYSKRRLKIALPLRKSFCLPTDLPKLVQSRKIFVSGFNLYFLSSKRKLGGGGSTYLSERFPNRGTCFCWYTKIFVDVMFIAQKVYSIYCITIDISHCHPKFTPKLQKLSHGQFYITHYSSSVVYHFGFFPRLMEKHRSPRSTSSKLGLLDF